MIGRNEMENRLGLLAKHKKEWKTDGSGLFGGFG